MGASRPCVTLPLLLSFVCYAAFFSLSFVHSSPLLHNNKRFESLGWLPDGYDAGPRAPLPRQAATLTWSSQPYQQLVAQATPELRQWWEVLQYSGKKPDGKLCAILLVKREANNLKFSLKTWSSIIDYYIIGIDATNNIQVIKDNSTNTFIKKLLHETDPNYDESFAIIQNHLAHIPGQIYTVHFDSLGSNLNELVQLAIKVFPGATHNVLLDADFRYDKQGPFHKQQLDLALPQLTFTVIDQTGTRRQSNHLFRNVPGARVTGRSQPQVVVPRLPAGPSTVSHTSLQVREFATGYRDVTHRNLTKLQRYIVEAEQDLVWHHKLNQLRKAKQKPYAKAKARDHVVLYNLGTFLFQEYSLQTDKKSEAARALLRRSVEYLQERLDIDDSDIQIQCKHLGLVYDQQLERSLKYRTANMLGDIHNHQLSLWREAERYYRTALRYSPDAVEPYYSMAVYYRSRRIPDLEESVRHARKALKLVLLHRERALAEARQYGRDPQTLAFPSLYTCHIFLEYTLALLSLKDYAQPSEKTWKKALTYIEQADCQETARDRKEKNDNIQRIKEKLAKIENDRKKRSAPKGKQPAQASAQKDEL